MNEKTERTLNLKTAQMQTTIRLPPDALDELQRIAREQHRSVANLVALIVQDYLKAQQERRA